ncbi:protein-disulfide reductase DsbD domain-containing protein [Roseibium sp. SCP14]|uniref:protein-disulfide reductase DsbD domain-containing protein n=1 Tax=Roseibium sp. SCP14 TaxID=3141375 RepID=UPI003339CA8D
MKRIVYTFIVLFIATLTSLRAETTDWIEVHGGAVRLISAGPIEDGQYLAGLEFMLEPGWHTYWRYPGEAGIPPQITLTDTENLKDVEILYPVPERYSDGFSESIVYHDGIVLPIRITPDDGEQNVRLNIDLFFGICKDICVPGDASLTLDLNPATEKDSLAAKLIQRDLANVPQVAATDSLKVESVSLTDEDRLVIETLVEAGATPELFVAGPEGSYIGLAKLASQSGDKVTWHLSTKGLKSGEGDDHLRLVLAIEGSAIEHLEPIQPSWVN